MEKEYGKRSSGEPPWERSILDNKREECVKNQQREKGEEGEERPDARAQSSGVLLPAPETTGSTGTISLIKIGATLALWQGNPKICQWMPHWEQSHDLFLILGQGGNPNEKEIQNSTYRKVVCVRGWEWTKGASRLRREVRRARVRLPKKDAAFLHQSQERGTASPGRKPSGSWPPSNILSNPTCWFQPIVLQKVIEKTWPPQDPWVGRVQLEHLTRPLSVECAFCLWFGSGSCVQGVLEACSEYVSEAP